MAPRAAVKPDVWQAPDTVQRGYPQQASVRASERKPLSATARKVLLVGGIIALMAGAFTGAQFIPVPDWMFSKAGTLVIESNPQGIKVLVNGKPQGVTPLTLRVEAGIHEVELYGPGKPKIFKVHVTRGDRVAQYIEFLSRP